MRNHVPSWSQEIRPFFADLSWPSIASEVLRIKKNIYVVIEKTLVCKTQPCNFIVTTDSVFLCYPVFAKRPNFLNSEIEISNLLIDKHVDLRIIVLV